MTALGVVRRWSVAAVLAHFVVGPLVARVLMSRHMRGLDPADTNFEDTEPEQEEHVR